MKYTISIYGTARAEAQRSHLCLEICPRSRDFQIPEQHNYQESGTSEQDFVDGKKKRNGGPELGNWSLREGAALRSQPRNRPQDPHQPVPSLRGRRRRNTTELRHETEPEIGINKAWRNQVGWRHQPGGAAAGSFPGQERGGVSRSAAKFCSNLPPNPLLLPPRLGERRRRTEELVTDTKWQGEEI